ncbi:SOS response-associated peptidase [Paenactinomyces guangxiensis]|uniref:Abasic site processing protein n=1 Tax=Paenactinomyces guangxiensis TaxID=1490290 RepID=A0A7W1WT37_9BACL|nr:SOS response-associated peptidase [Paenactinomyces guangxiensis]MBA4495576.1 SOS response-associated peptidase [Paenactinomyces guangxiensis]MBH8592834.1 SOS response-associated peptidase [Paenactinomyces guangxiensis]
MCGRFTLFTEPGTLQERFEFEVNELKPRYNIAPTQPVLAVMGGEQRKGTLLRWGLIPFWSKDTKIGNRMINARSETVHEKPSFKRLLKRQRCLILSSGFYEWKKTGNGKQPCFIRLASGEPFAFAGLWDHWKQGDKEITSCTIITTIPNDLMKPIHHRMPAILRPEDEAAWLDPGLEEPNVLRSLLNPYPAEEMAAYPVSNLVNSPKNDIPECILPIPKS